VRIRDADAAHASDSRARPRTLQLIQAFRGAAALMVMLYHVGMVNTFYSPFLGNVFGFGHSGIDFFFVLSGFIMLYVHYEQAGRVRATGRFLALRAARIFPIYWCVLAVTVACFWAFPQTPDRIWAPGKTLDPATLVRAIFLYQQDQDAIVPVAWTLSYELVFYLFFSVFFLLGAGAFALLMLIWSVAIAVQWSGVAYLGPYPVLLRPLVGEFFLGCLAAWLAIRLRGLRVPGWWLVPPVMLVAAVARAELVGAIDGYTWYALPYFLLISPVRSTTSPRRGSFRARSCCWATRRTPSISSTSERSCWHRSCSTASAPRRAARPTSRSPSCRCSSSCSGSSCT
jgi:peptidoglycan/LPS O-acetylase OafA/YrhL